MKFISVLVYLVITLLLVSCKKNAAEKACWQIIDFSGNPITTICDKTEDELVQCVRSGNCGYGGSGFSSCNYYKAGGQTYCWQIGNNYISDITENNAQLLARCYYGGATVTKVSCQSCQYWFNREKRTYKPASSITYSNITRKQYCGDTTSTLYQGRQIIRKNDADSLIVIQFSTNGSNW